MAGITRTIVTALALLWGAIGAAEAGVFNPEFTTLDNGMQVVVVQNHRAPVVTQTVYYKVGAADEVDGKSGLAHFLEHLMFKGTKNIPAGEFSSTIARNGGQENAFTTSDYTGYYQTVAKDRLELVMKMEADRMTGLTLTAPQVEPERLVVLEERRLRTDNRPGSQLAEQVDAALYMNYPYRRPVIGWEQEIRALTLDDIRAFYKKWYGPDNAILIVSGDVTMAEVKPLAERYYGVIPAMGAPAKRIRADEPVQHAARTVTLKDSRVRQPSWSKYYLAPSLTWGSVEQAYPLEVLNQILSGGRTSRLTQSLVIEQKLALGASAGYDDDLMGPSSFSFSGSPQPGVPLDKVSAGIQAEIDKLIKDGVTEEEVSRAKAQMDDGAIYARDSDRKC
jgi:zinc protease